MKITVPKSTLETALAPIMKMAPAAKPSRLAVRAERQKVWICRSLNKVGTEEVNEPAPHEEGRPEFRRDRRDARPERRAPRGGDNNASTKAN